MGAVFSSEGPVMNFLNKLVNLVILNVCFLISCIPIVTIGAALSALYSVNLRMVRDEEAYVFRSYWKAFRGNLKKGTLCLAIMAALGAVLYLDSRAAQILPGAAGLFCRIVSVVFFVFYAVLFLYIFPYVGWFDDDLKTCLKNALLMGVGKIGYTLAVLLITAAVASVVLLNAEILVRGLVLWLLFGIALLNYVQSYFIRIVFSKYESFEV